MKVWEIDNWIGIIDMYDSFSTEGSFVQAIVDAWRHADSSNKIVMQDVMTKVCYDYLDDKLHDLLATNPKAKQMYEQYRVEKIAEEMKYWTRDPEPSGKNPWNFIQ